MNKKNNFEQVEKRNGLNRKIQRKKNRIKYFMEINLWKVSSYCSNDFITSLLFVYCNGENGGIFPAGLYIFTSSFCFCGDLYH